MLSALKGEEQKTRQDPVERPSGFTHGASVYVHLLCVPSAPSRVFTEDKAEAQRG